MEFGSTGIWVEPHNYVHDEPMVAELGQVFIEHDVCSAIDIGCGDGFVSKELAKLGIKSLGIDGYIVDKRTDLLFVAHDLSTPLITNPFDAVTSFEVGEHIPEEFEDTFFKNLIQAEPKILVVSWAKPGQNGKGHVNCKPYEYVSTRLSSFGYTLDEKTTKRLQDVSKRYWHQNNLMFLTR